MKKKKEKKGSNWQWWSDMHQNTLIISFSNVKHVWRKWCYFQCREEEEEKDDGGEWRFGCIKGEIEMFSSMAYFPLWSTGGERCRGNWSSIWLDNDNEFNSKQHKKRGFVFNLNRDYLFRLNTLDENSMKFLMIIFREKAKPKGVDFLYAKD